jgi:transposase-like protein
VQTCIVHLIRHSLKYVPRRQYEQVTKDLRPIYTAIDADAAMLALEGFEEKWGKQIPVIGQAWRRAWEHVTPFMAFEPEVRRVIYTTNAIEALNRQLRKAVKTKGHFPTEDAARKRDTLDAGACEGTDGGRWLRRPGLVCRRGALLGFVRAEVCLVGPGVCFLGARGASGLGLVVWR